MKEYIEKDDILKTKFASASACPEKSTDYAIGWNDAIDAILDNAPRVTAVIPDLIPITLRKKQTGAYFTGYIDETRKLVFFDKVTLELLWRMGYDYFYEDETGSRDRRRFGGSEGET